jgi:hypothetical protein
MFIYRRYRTDFSSHSRIFREQLNEIMRKFQSRATSTIEEKVYQILQTIMFSFMSSYGYNILHILEQY